MPATFVHLSDIHFGQEQEKGAEMIVHDDVKEQLIKDAARLVETYAGHATGVIVTGDIAYAGKHIEYQRAADWLDRLATAIGCAKTDVQVVPGNHDIDREAISSGCRLMLDNIIKDGEPQLDAFLESELDREVLYGRFAGYRPFAEGYDCPLDRTGGIASERSVELVPGRTLRFIGLNSALICSTKDKAGSLLLGARQHVLPREAGEELVVMSHHPLNWLRDSDEARRYVRSRARVFLSGHEHNPSWQVEKIKDGCDLLMLTAGATVPPKAEAGYTYTYNLMIFDWDAVTDGLKVTTIPRTWSPEDTDFGADDAMFGGREPTVVLNCPNFRNAVKTGVGGPALTPESSIEKVEECLPVESGSTVELHRGEVMADPFPLLLLRFFRDLSPAQRLAVLVELRALPDEWSDSLTHAMERRIVDALAKAGQLTELEAAIDKIQDQSGNVPRKEP